MSKPVSERTKQRRRVLRAVAGAPVILTLPSGVALANATLGCDKKSSIRFQEEGTAVFPTVNNDSWMRVKLRKLRIKPAATSWVDGFEYSVSGSLRYFKVEGDIASPVTPSYIGNPPSPQVEFATPEAYYYALVDYNLPDPGVLLDKRTPGVTPIAGVSCWNSLTADQLTSNVLLP